MATVLVTVHDADKWEALPRDEREMYVNRVRDDMGHRGFDVRDDAGLIATVGWSR